MEETQRTLHGSNVLVMGFGRIGKVLAKMLDGIGAKVYCEARKNEDISWIKAYGYNPIHLNDLDENVKFSLIRTIQKIKTTQAIIAIPLRLLLLRRFLAFPVIYLHL